MLNTAMYWNRCEFYCTERGYSPIPAPLPFLSHSVVSWISTWAFFLFTMLVTRTSRLKLCISVLGMCILGMCKLRIYSSVFPLTTLLFRDFLLVQDSKFHWAQTNQFCSTHEVGVTSLEKQGAALLWNTSVTCEHDEIQTNTFWMQRAHCRSYESQRQTFCTYFCPGNPSQNMASLNIKLPTAVRERGTFIPFT